MILPRIYADFNSIENSEGGSTSTLRLTGYGTIRSLSNQKLQLFEGMALVVFEPNDIEADGIAHYDPQTKGPNRKTRRVDH